MTLYWPLDNGGLLLVKLASPAVTKDIVEKAPNVLAGHANSEKATENPGVSMKEMIQIC